LKISEPEEYALTFNPLLTRTFPSPVVQVLPPRSDFTDSIPLHWATMDDTPQVSGSGVPTTPTSTIVTSEIFPPGMSNTMTSVVYSTIVALINNITPLVIGSTLSMSVTMSFSSTTNTFSFDMSLMGMLNALTGSQSTSQVSNIGVGSSSIPYQAIPWGGGHIPPSFPSLGVGISIFQS
jgi:hypothetical protein